MLVTLANLLSNAGHDSDAALVMEHSALTPYLQQLKLWSAGNLYTVSQNTEFSVRSSHNWVVVSKSLSYLVLQFVIGSPSGCPNIGAIYDLSHLKKVNCNQGLLSKSMSISSTNYQ